MDIFYNYFGVLEEEYISDLKIRICMDPISLSVLKIVAKEELISSGGVTPYKVMRELNLYPSFAYKLVQRLEATGVLSCTDSIKGRRCVLTIYGVLLLYRHDEEFRPYAEKLFAKKLGLGTTECLKTMLDQVIKEKELPRSFAELLGWCILNSDVPDVRLFLYELVRSNRWGIILTPRIVAVRRNGKVTMICDSSCNNCSIDKCKYIGDIAKKVEIIS
jgi:predicted transcriptional regulator